MTANNKWYVGGLHFECRGCGDCCAGPGEGFIWLTRREIELIAAQLEMTVGSFRQKYVKRLINRYSLIEEPKTKDCIFLKQTETGRGCGIYAVRPNQCRTWPFWTSNLQSPNTWNQAAGRCPGINRGRLYTFEQIEKLRRQKQWWPDEDE